MKRKSFYSFITIVLPSNSLISCSSSSQTEIETYLPKDVIGVSPTQNKNRHRLTGGDAKKAVGICVKDETESRIYSRFEESQH